MKHIRIMLYCIVVMFSLVSVPLASAAPKYRFAYLTFPAEGQTNINLLDPNNPSQPEAPLFEMLTPIILPLYIVNNSTGEWVAAAYQQPANVMRLTNTVTWEKRDIAQGVFPILVHGVMGQFNSWSPNGHYLAFLMRQTDVFDAYIYSLIDKSLVKLTAGKVDSESLVWSSDSTQLAVGSGTCNGQDDCNLAINVFDVSTHQSKQQVDLSKSVGQLIGGALCTLAWSPDSRYISFVPMCSGAWISRGYVTGPEVYVWDTQTGKVLALSSFVSGKVKNENEIQVTATYRMFWYDAQTLLVGAIYGIYGPDISVNTQTVIYEMPDGKATVLSPKAIDELAINPVSKELVIREISSLDVDFKVKSASARSMTFTKSNLLTSIAIDESGGCNLAWSPDGATLAYVQHSGSDCSISLQSLAFMNKTTGKTKVQALPTIKGAVHDGIILVGWVAS